MANEKPFFMFQRCEIGMGGCQDHYTQNLQKEYGLTDKEAETFDSLLGEMGVIEITINGEGSVFFHFTNSDSETACDGRISVGCELSIRQAKKIVHALKTAISAGRMIDNEDLAPMYRDEDDDS